jgi:hypothetical protein
LTNKKIQQLAYEKMRKSCDTMLIASIYFFILPILILLVESLIYIIAMILDIDYRIFDFSYYTQSVARVWFLVLRLCLYFSLISSQLYLIRRYFISAENEDHSVQQYVAGHLRTILIPSVKCSAKLLALKLLVISPAAVGIYGIYYFGQKGNTGEITLFGLICFMLSIGFTIVWIGISVHYFMSLSMVKYINQLNPRSNFFDACDLSVKLMDGKHSRLISFYASLLWCLPFALLLYPLILIVPFFAECRLIFAEQIMGKYWQDKLPAMARRWKKQQIRQGKA